MKQWITGTLGTVLAGVLVYWLTIGFPPWLVGSARMGELQWGKNLQGSDILNIDKPDVNTAGECCDLCLKNAQCKAMTFVMHPGGAGGVCWLKDGVPPLTPNASMTSAIKISH